MLHTSIVCTTILLHSPHIVVVRSSVVIVAVVVVVAVVVAAGCFGVDSSGRRQACRSSPRPSAAPTGCSGRAP